jgi:hypothetical protein
MVGFNMGYGARGPTPQKLEERQCIQEQRDKQMRNRTWAGSDTYPILNTRSSWAIGNIRLGHPALPAVLGEPH